MNSICNFFLFEIRWFIKRCHFVFIWFFLSGIVYASYKDNERETEVKRVPKSDVIYIIGNALVVNDSAVSNSESTYIVIEDKGVSSQAKNNRISKSISEKKQNIESKKIKKISVENLISIGSQSDPDVSVLGHMIRYASVLNQDFQLKLLFQCAAISRLASTQINIFSRNKFYEFSEILHSSRKKFLSVRPPPFRLEC